MNLAFQPSQCVGRYGVSRPYRRKRASRHSCAPSSVPFAAYGCNVIQSPVFVARCSRHARWTGGPSSVVVSASSARRWTFCRTAVQPSRRLAEWSAIRNSTWHLSAATRCPVMTQDAVQFSGAVWVGLVRANPACLTVRRGPPLCGTPLPSPSNNIGSVSKRVPEVKSFGDEMNKISAYQAAKA